MYNGRILERREKTYIKSPTAISPYEESPNGDKHLRRNVLQPNVLRPNVIWRYILRGKLLEPNNATQKTEKCFDIYELCSLDYFSLIRGYCQAYSNDKNYGINNGFLIYFYLCSDALPI